MVLLVLKLMNLSKPLFRNTSWSGAGGSFWAPENGETLILNDNCSLNWFNYWTHNNCSSVMRDDWSLGPHPTFGREFWESIEFLGWLLISSFIIFGGAIPFLFQYWEFSKRQTSKGFSLMVCLTLLVANILRIFFWCVFYYCLGRKLSLKHEKVAKLLNVRQKCRMKTVRVLCLFN